MVHLVAWCIIHVLDVALPALFKSAAQFGTHVCAFFVTCHCPAVILAVLSLLVL